MDIQLRQKNSNHYAFVQNATTRKDICFRISFMDWNEAKQDNDNKGKLTLSAVEFAQWWNQAKQDGWKIVDPS
jgi:hypothetical protein